MFRSVSRPAAEAEPIRGGRGGGRREPGEHGENPGPRQTIRQVGAVGVGDTGHYRQDGGTQSSSFPGTVPNKARCTIKNEILNF